MKETAEPGCDPLLWYFSLQLFFFSVCSFIFCIGRRALVCNLPRVVLIATLMRVIGKKHEANTATHRVSSVYGNYFEAIRCTFRMVFCVLFTSAFFKNSFPFGSFYKHLFSRHLQHNPALQVLRTVECQLGVPADLRFLHLRRPRDVPSSLRVSGNDSSHPAFYRASVFVVRCFRSAEFASFVTDETFDWDNDE